MTKDEQELARIAAEAAMKPVADLANMLFGGVAEEIGGMWQDSLKVRTFERQLKLLPRIQELITQARFEPRQNKDSISIPLLNAATLEDDERLQQAWACLIANAANPAANVHPAFIQILESMAHLDAVILDLTYKRLLAEMKTKGNFQIVFLEKREDARGLEDRQGKWRRYIEILGSTARGGGSAGLGFGNVMERRRSRTDLQGVIGVLPRGTISGNGSQLPSASSTNSR